MRSAYAIDKCAGLSYPTHCLKSRGSVRWNIFLEYKTGQATLFAPQNDFFASFATNKAKNILKMHFSRSCSDTIYSKSIKKNRKKVPFLKYQSTFSECKGVSRASSDRIIYFNKI